MSLTTSYSLWFAPLCLVLGLGYAWLLYRRGVERHGWSRGLNALLFALRAVVVAFLAFLLLSPVVRSWVREVRKPVVVIAHDGSNSLRLAGDTSALRTTFLPGLQDLVDKLEEKYEVRMFTYADEVEEGLNTAQQGQRTDIAQVLREIHDRLAGPDLGALILDGDGIYNRGRDPRHDADRLGVPIHTIALGDTTVHPDLALLGLGSNRLAYLGNQFPVVVRVEADHLDGRRSRVVVRHKEKVVLEREFVINGDPFFTEIPLLIQTDELGLQRYQVEVVPVEGEIGIKNNSDEVVVNVLDDRQRILLLGAAPHPDLGALHNALSGSQAYTVVSALARQEIPSPDGFDLVVMHNLPAAVQGVNPFLATCREKGIPLVFILGSGTDINAFNALGTGVSLTGVRPTHSNAQARFNKNMDLFVVPQEQIKTFERFPPLQVPFGQFSTAQGAVVVFTQRIGLVDTKDPLLAIGPQGAGRGAVVCGEGIWRWRLADQQLNGTTEHFDAFFRKLVQLLADRNRADRFRVTVADVYEVGQHVVLQAEVYNANYELITEPEVELVLRDEAGNEQVYAFSPYERGHKLVVEGLAEGSYTYTARTRIGTEALSAPGEFVVRAVLTEGVRTVADHALLRDLSARTGGVAVDAQGTDRIIQQLVSEEGLVSRSYAYASTMDLIGLKWPFFLILLLLALEWTIRRWNGAY